MSIIEDSKEIFENIKKVRPVMHNISNIVTANDCANITLACGGSPTMADDPDEVEDITSACNGFVLNMGNTGGFMVETMLRAGKKKQRSKSSNSIRSSWCRGSEKKKSSFRNSIKRNKILSN